LREAQESVRHLGVPFQEESALFVGPLLPSEERVILVETFGLGDGVLLRLRRLLQEIVIRLIRLERVLRIQATLLLLVLLLLLLLLRLDRRLRLWNLNRLVPRLHDELLGWRLLLNGLGHVAGRLLLARVDGALRDASLRLN